MRYINHRFNAIAAVLLLNVVGCSSVKIAETPANTSVWCLDEDTDTKGKVTLLLGMSVSEVEDQLGHPKTIEKKTDAAIERQKWVYQRNIIGPLVTTFSSKGREVRQPSRFIDEVEIVFSDGKLKEVKIERRRDEFIRWDMTKIKN